MALKQGKPPACQSNDLNLITKSHILERENQLAKLFLDLYKCVSAYTTPQ